MERGVNLRVAQADLPARFMTGERSRTSAGQELRANSMNVNRVLRRGAVVTGVLAGVVLGSGGVAGASGPVVQACVDDVQRRNRGLPPGDVEQLIVGFAQAPDTEHPGLGDGIQLLQAGMVLDEVAPNTCNG